MRARPFALVFSSSSHSTSTPQRAPTQNSTQLLSGSTTQKTGSGSSATAGRSRNVSSLCAAASPPRGSSQRLQSVPSGPPSPLWTSSSVPLQTRNRHGSKWAGCGAFRGGEGEKGGGYLNIRGWLELNQNSWLVAAMGDCRPPTPAPAGGVGERPCLATVLGRGGLGGQKKAEKGQTHLAPWLAPRRMEAPSSFSAIAPENTE